MKRDPMDKRFKVLLLMVFMAYILVAVPQQDQLRNQ
jgi:hypothetical protein